MKSEVRNLKETKELIEKYRSITVSDINEANRNTPYYALSDLTGFGSIVNCILCKKVTNQTTELVDCVYCIHNDDLFIGYPCVNNYSYQKLSQCNTVNVNELLDALKVRADYLEELLNKHI